MQTTFITIHDLSSNARILYSSDSIVDTLGHTPDEVVNKPCWDFFHPSDVESAREIHGRGVKLDKAAVLAYCYLLHRDGRWINCECCFTCVYNVMVVSTSVYRPGAASQKRAIEAPMVRRVFTSSPQDPRYHMLSHLSSKFQRPITEETHEPRAALFLNRFTRTLTIMYATSGIDQIIGISSEDMKGRSFYFCIAEQCLEDAVKCLETAKGNDSIAYLRFWFRDPRQDDPPPDVLDAEMYDDGNVTDANMTDGGNMTDTDTEDADSYERSPYPNQRSPLSNQRSPSAQEQIYDQDRPIELEAVVSCTSDGLVVIIRQARPLLPGVIPEEHQNSQAIFPQLEPNISQHTRGMFAAPWAPEPIFIPEQPRPALPGWYHGMHPLSVQPPMPYYGGPLPQDFLNSIRDVAVFAWALVGINGCLSEYTRGKPDGEAQPHDGFSIWVPTVPQQTARAIDSGNETQTSTGSTTSPDSANNPYGLPARRD